MRTLVGVWEENQLQHSFLDVLLAKICFISFSWNTCFLVLILEGICLFSAFIFSIGQWIIVMLRWKSCTCDSRMYRREKEWYQTCLLCHCYLYCCNMGTLWIHNLGYLPLHLQLLSHSTLITYSSSLHQLLPSLLSNLGMFTWVALVESWSLFFVYASLIWILLLSSPHF